MTQMQRALIILIKSALSNQVFDLPDNFDLTEVFEVARVHGVNVMAYYGALACGVNKDAEPMREEAMRVYQSISISETQMAAVRRIMDELEAQEVNHMPLKGTLLKDIYPHGEMRRMTDADILVDYGRYEIICEIMKNLGYIEKYESDHELVWERKPVNIEFHKRLIPSYNKDYYQYYGDGWKRAVKMDGFSFRYKMEPCDEMIYLFTHFAKHYRDSGIGLRHIVDLWVYRKNNPDMDEEYIREELKKLLLLEFYDNIMRTLDVWFGDCHSDEKTEFITQFIFSCGEFGREHISSLSGALKSTKNGQTDKSAKIGRIIKALFPGYTEMSRKYKVLKKLPLLLPFMWIDRIFKKIFQKGKVQKFVTHRLNVDGDEVLEYQQLLNYVGLDFNFRE